MAKHLQIKKLEDFQKISMFYDIKKFMIIPPSDRTHYFNNSFFSTKSLLENAIRSSKIKEADINKVNVYFRSIITDTYYSKKNKTLEYGVDTYYGLKDMEYLYDDIDDS